MSKHKCYICKKAIRLYDPIITFYSPNSIHGADETEYNFCAKECADKFLENRKEFWEIVKDLDVNQENTEGESPGTGD